MDGQLAMNKSIILAIDAGSSSIRCTGYEYHGDYNEEDTHDIEDNIENDPSSCENYSKFRFYSKVQIQSI